MSNLEKLLSNFPSEVEAGIILGVANRKYLLDMDSSAGTIIVTKDKAYFIIDSRYFLLAQTVVKGAEVILEKNKFEQIAEILKKHGVKNVCVDNSYVTLTELEAFKKNLSGFNFDSSNAALDTAILETRRIKTDEEVRRIKAAQKVTDEGFAHIVDYIKPGMTEIEISLELEFFMRKNGADSLSFSTICASGKNGAKPHAVPSDKKVEVGDFITMDFGCMVDGYCSDMTRTVALGEVSEKQKLVYNTVLKAQTEAIKAVKVGVPCNEIDKVARDIIGEAGFSEYFGHGLGHSVGVEIHEDPRFAPHDSEITRDGIIMTVEPGIYIPGEFGVRIEDMGMVTENGYDDYTNSPKELIIIK